MEPKLGFIYFGVYPSFLAHSFAAAMVYLGCLWGFWVAKRKLGWWPRMRGWARLIAPAVICFLLISLREPFDVYHGGAIGKSINDWLSWCFGFGATAWIVYRLQPVINDIVSEVIVDRNRRRNA